MKSYQAALVLTLCVALGIQLPAVASPASHSGTSSSYKSGFSSQKGKVARSQPAPPANRQSGPGAFGQVPGSPASAQPDGRRNGSAMSRDLDQSATQANALKTLDARRAASAQQPLPPLNDTPARPSQSQPSSQPGYQAGYPPPGYQPPPVIVQQPSSGLMHGVLGFMLGRAISQSNQPVSYPTVSGGQTASQSAGQTPADGMTVTGMPGLGAPAAVPAQQPASSFGAGVLRWFLWLSVLSVMVWAVVYAVRKLRRLRAENTTHYSFERN